MPYIQTKKVPTTLNFHPNYDGNLVEVCLGTYITSLKDKEEYYVSIHGRDDTSLQTRALSFKKAKALYDRIKRVTMKEAELFRGSSQNNGFPSNNLTQP